MDKTDPKTTPSRRAVLARLGLAAGAAYMAPVMLSMSTAQASSGSAPSRASRPSAPSRASRPSAPSRPSRPSAPSRPRPAGSGNTPRPAPNQASASGQRLTFQQWLLLFFGRV